MRMWTSNPCRDHITGSHQFCGVESKVLPVKVCKVESILLYLNSVVTWLVFWVKILQTKSGQPSMFILDKKTTAIHWNTHVSKLCFFIWKHVWTRTTSTQAPLFHAYTLLDGLMPSLTLVSKAERISNISKRSADVNAHLSTLIWCTLGPDGTTKHCDDQTKQLRQSKCIAVCHLGSSSMRTQSATTYWNLSKCLKGLNLRAISQRKDMNDATIPVNACTGVCRYFGITRHSSTARLKRVPAPEEWWDQRNIPRARTVLKTSENTCQYKYIITIFGQIWSEIFSILARITT